ncbi:conserved hypothetical protein, partial [Trichinella spiralis]|uniref:hypothetical protein n=1 Tax=Trichinella spiralis TaxID=6334 RepID=UPI0001EFE845
MCDEFSAAGLLPTELIDDEPAEQQKDDVDINSEEMKETFFESLFIPVMTSSNLEEDGCQSDDDEDLESATVELQERMDSESDEDIDDEKDDDDNNTNDGNVHPDVNDEHRRCPVQICQLKSVHCPGRLLFHPSEPTSSSSIPRQQQQQ